MSEASSPHWRRKGRLVSVAKGHSRWASHAQMPTVLPLSDRLWRIYFGARDEINRSRIFAVDVDPGDDMRIVAEHFEPLFELGPPGAFDQAGMVPSAAIVADGKVRLYYGALFLRPDVPGQATIGLAISDDGLRFSRAFAGPVHGLGPFDPFFSSVPTLLKTPHGFRMWYVGGTQWGQVDGDLVLFSEIRTTRSSDGLIWDSRSETAVALEATGGVGLGRPWVADTSDGRRLWFSQRGEIHRKPGADAYHLMSIAADQHGSFAATVERSLFENPPAVGDFDSWMQCYACIVAHGRDLVMFYNGNDFGRDGFGWAVLPESARRDGAR